METKNKISSDKIVLTALAAGDQAAFNWIYEKYSPMVHRRAMYYTRGCNTTSEDIMQTVFMKIWINRENLDRFETLEGYLLLSARNTSFNYLKEKNKHLTGKCMYEKSLANAVSDADNKIVVKEYTNVWMKGISSLPEKQKKIYQLMDEGYKHKEIAELKKISVHTVKETGRIARKSVRMYVSRQLGLSFKHEQEAA